MTDIMVAKNTLKDYSTWRTLFDGNTAMQAEYGLHIKGVYQSKGDPNTVFVLIEVEDMARAQEMMKKAEESGLFEKAGVIDAERTLCTDVT
jgi:hypothetical protein